MIRSDQILNTVEMVQKENLDVRAVTLGIDLLDCRRESVADTCRRVQEKIQRYASTLVPTCVAMSRKYGVPIVNKRLAVTPAA
jgi:uncharacterized protein